MANFCGYCGSRLVPGAAFCPNCGAELPAHMRAAADYAQEESYTEEYIPQEESYTEEYIPQEESYTEEYIPQEESYTEEEYIPQEESYGEGDDAPQEERFGESYADEEYVDDEQQEELPRRGHMVLRVVVILLVLLLLAAGVITALAYTGVVRVPVLSEALSGGSARDTTEEVADAQTTEGTGPTDTADPQKEDARPTAADTEAETLPEDEESAAAREDDLQSHAKQIYARKAANGTSYIPLPDGTCVEIAGDISYAAITKDREHIVVLLADGTLCVTDPEQSSQKELATGVSEIWSVYNEYVVYQLAGMESGRAVMYDGSTGFQSEHAALEALEGSVGDYQPQGFCTKDDALLVAYAGIETEQGFETKVWIQAADGALVETSIPAKSEMPYSSLRLYTDQDEVDYLYANEVTTLYMSAFNMDNVAAGEDLYDALRSVYSISLDGECHEMLSRIKNYNIAGGRIAYVDENDHLYVGSIRDGVISDAVLVTENGNKGATENSAGFMLSENGEYLYYVTPTGEGSLQMLHAYRVSDANDVALAEVTDELDSVWYSHDGATVVYSSDDFDDWRSKLLYTYTYGDAEPTLIAENIVMWSIVSGYDHHIIDPEGFVYEQFTQPAESVSDDAATPANLMYYNGADSVVLAEQVVQLDEAGPRYY